jgi:selenide, water dikinase
MEHPQVLVGLENPDDAGVYKINDDLALIQTVDFFTPVVDNPYDFGQIAAVNSLNDVYAMGGQPITAMNLVAFPSCTLPMEVLAEILAGGAAKIAEAGAVLIGGHTIEDKEPKYGLSVTGTVHPEKVLRNYTAKPGDVLILTKPIGIGVVTTAIKGGAAKEEDIKFITKLMATLNKEAAEGFQHVGTVNACTDITGFGLMGHIYEMAAGSNVTIKLDITKVPFIPQAKDFAAMGLVPGGAYSNRSYLKDKYAIQGEITEIEDDLLFDPQTAGGLLISLPEKDADKLMKYYHNQGVNAWLIGEVLNQEEVNIKVKGR